MKDGPSLEQSDVLLAGVHQFGVYVFTCGDWSHAENAVLTLNDDFLVIRQVVGDGHWLANAQVDVGAIGDVLDDALCNLSNSAAGVVGAHGVVVSAKATRLTKMPGVMIVSGSSSPKSTI